VVAEGHWGDVLREHLRDYVHWATIGVLCEFLPRPDNRVTLADETDRHGLPVARFDYSRGENDRLLVDAGTRTMHAILRAAGAEDVVTIDRTAHLVGGCRMGAGPEDGVVDRDLRTFAVDNLYVTDGSVLPTQGAANPALTIMALAARCADHLSHANRAG
jgi:choline dehydrogenase-like flavoprotein